MKKKNGNALDEATEYWKKEAERLELLIGVAKVTRKALEDNKQ